MARTIIVALTLWTVLAIAPSSAFADESEISDLAEQTAKEEFERGSQLFSENRFSEAAKAFRTAYSARPAWKLWFNIGQAEAAATHYGAALVAFENYLAMGGDKVPLERSADVLNEIKRLRELVGSLDVEAEPGCVVRVNGEARGTTPLSGLIKIAAGITHTITIEKDDKVVHEQPLRLSGGDERLIRVPTPTEPTATEQASVPELQPEPEPEPVAPPDKTLEPAVSEIQPSATPARNSPMKIAGIFFLGVGIASLAAGGITGIAAFKKAQSLEDDCPNNVCAKASAVDSMNSSQTLGTVSTILFAAGAMLTTTGIVLLIAGRKRLGETMIGSHHNQLLSVSLRGLTLEGRF
ncbi:MAG: hypothetical protein JXR76_13225 [Deltaproteobacteria bacterium]|nr:hypothetical protein [Deltaproteobacteria bacterium]